MDVLARIRDLLKERGWSVYRLAQAADLPQSTLANLFMRNNTPTLPTLERICAAMGITLAEFFSDKETVPAPQELDLLMRTRWEGLSAVQKQLVLELMEQFRR